MRHHRQGSMGGDSMGGETEGRASSAENRRSGHHGEESLAGAVGLMKRSPFALGVLAAAVAAILTHAASLTAPFFADDWLFLDQVLASPDPLGNYFRPLGRQVWFWLLVHVGGERPLVFHVANLACLVAAVVLLALLARRIAGPFAGVVAAAYLAVHYAADVPVLWVSGSQELLSLALGLAALNAYVRRHGLLGEQREEEEPRRE